MAGIKILTPPADLPIGLCFIKKQLRLDETDNSEDEYIQGLMAAAVERAQFVTNRLFCTQTVREYRHHFPRHHRDQRLFTGEYLEYDRDHHHHRNWELMRSPVDAILQVQYLDPAGTIQTMPSGVAEIAVESGGQEYTAVPVVTITAAPGDATGGGALAVATLTDGAVTGIMVTRPGALYTLPPAVTVTAAQDDTTGTGAMASATITPTTFNADLVLEPGTLYPAPHTHWPLTKWGTPNTAWVDYIVGYAVNDTGVPHTLKAAMALMVSHWYTNREPVQQTGVSELPMAVTALLEQNKMWYLQ